MYHDTQQGDLTAIRQEGKAESSCRVVPVELSQLCLPDMD
jgi:hypothetical protein